MGICLSWLGCVETQGCGAGGEEREARPHATANGEAKGATAVIGDYNLIPLSMLLGIADLAVTGTVIDEDDHTFTIRVSKFLVERMGSGDIRVKKYVPPAQIGRNALPYTRGQRFALFLEKPNQKEPDKPWTILGYAGEGEMPIQGGNVYLGPYDLKGLDFWPLEIEGAAWESQRFGLDDFEDAVRNYPRCFSWELVEIVKNQKRRQRWKVSKTCEDETVETYRARSWLHDYLVQESVKGIAVNGSIR